MKTLNIKKLSVLAAAMAVGSAFAATITPNWFATKDGSSLTATDGTWAGAARGTATDVPTVAEIATADTAIAVDADISTQELRFTPSLALASYAPTVNKSVIETKITFESSYAETTDLPTDGQAGLAVVNDKFAYWDVAAATPAWVVSDVDATAANEYQVKIELTYGATPTVAYYYWDATKEEYAKIGSTVAPSSLTKATAIAFTGYGKIDDLASTYSFDAAAQIGDTYYATLRAALDANTGTIVALEGDEITCLKAGQYTINTNGKKIIFEGLIAEEGYPAEYYKSSVSGSTLSITASVTGFAAQIGTVAETGNANCYWVLSDALAAADEGDTIQLLATVDQTTVPTIADDNLLIDLAGQQLTLGNYALALDYNLTITNSNKAAGGFLNKAQVTIAAGKTLDCATLDWGIGGILSTETAAETTATFTLGAGSTLKLGSDIAPATYLAADPNFLTGVEGSLFVAGEKTYKYDATATAWLDQTDYTITVMDGIQNGSVTASVDSAKEGTEVTLTVTPADGYQLASLTVNGEAVSGTKFTMPAAAVTIAATFEAIPTYAITVSDVAGGTVTASAASAIEGATITVTATPADEYTLTALTYTYDGLETPIDIKEAKSFTMPAKAVTINATFTLNTYAITANTAENGSYTVKVDDDEVAAAAKDATVVVTASPNSGYELDTITVKDAEEATVTVTDGSFTMPAKAVTITVTFKKVNYTITVNTVGEGTVVVSNSTAAVVTANYGDALTVTAVPAANYALATVAVTNASDVAVTYTDGSFTMPAANVTITVTFTATSSKKPVAPGESGDPMPSEDAAKAAIEVADPPNATDLTSDQTKAYKGMFEKQATQSGDTWTATVVLTSDAKTNLEAQVSTTVNTTAIANQLATVAAAEASDKASTVTVSNVQPGFYYSIKAGSTLGGMSEGARKLAGSSASVTLDMPKVSGNAMFYRILVNTTAE